MGNRMISYDLGTGGNKASLYDLDGNCLAWVFVPYKTIYPQAGWHEQRPVDWWEAVCESTRRLLEKTGENGRNIECLAISGHSLGAVPVDRNGVLLRDTTPIWSDTRAVREAEEFFSRVDNDQWYMTTGNGFPAALYTVFKIMWYKNNEYQMYKNAYKIIGTKDYINYKLTGIIKTDHSYASGSGVYDLKANAYHDGFIEASGIDREKLPDIVLSTSILGQITPKAAAETGLGPNVLVVCGGVDNSCMALGAKNIEEGRVYTSLGSSAWIAVSSSEPVLDLKAKPYVFTHVIPGLYTSAVSIFSAGTSFTWLRDNLCPDLKESEARGGQNAYRMMDMLAERSPAGANRLIFNPSLAGGTSQDASANLRGAYIGLDLKHNREDLIRACMEGIAMNLRLRLDVLRMHCSLHDEMLLVGGGSKSPLYRRIFADVYNMDIIKTNIDQDAAALGAVAVAAAGCGIWKDFSRMDSIHKTAEKLKPDTDNNRIYERLLKVFDFAAHSLSEISDKLCFPMD
ncbi:MAG: pentose kinase [Clostridiaceae bacterium]|nr:pentose kinase [Clostridiaceae bacterium]